MRIVYQRVSSAEVRTGGAVIGRIERGALLLVGVAVEDTDDIARRMADKVVGLRVFADADGRTNLDLAAIGGSLLVVSQFTLLADSRRGRRPSFDRAAMPAAAEPLVEALVAGLRQQGVHVETGQFGAGMAVTLVNDGPFTLVLDSNEVLGPS